MVACFSAASRAQLHQSSLYIDDLHGHFSILQAANGGGTLTFPAGTGMVVMSPTGAGYTGAGVILQSATPGTAQTGDFNITGTGIIGTLTATATTNQLVLGTTRTATISAVEPATSSRTYTISDPGANAFLAITSATPVDKTVPLWNSTAGLITNSSILDNGTVSTAEGITSTGTAGLTSGTASSHTGEINLYNSGSANELTIQSASIATSSRTYTIPDAGAAASFIMSTSGSGQNINGGLTLGTALVGASGGTGYSTYTAGDILYAATTGSALTTLGTGGAGNSGEVLTINGSGLPAWAAASGGGSGFSWSSITNNANSSSITYYSTANGVNYDNAGTLPLESEMELPIPFACTLDAMYVQSVVSYGTGSSGWNGSGQTITVTVYKNGSSTSFAVPVTFNAADPVGTVYPASSHNYTATTLALAVGDRISLHISGTQTLGTQGYENVSLHFH
jgi:hypothetical protein